MGHDVTAVIGRLAAKGDVYQAKCLLPKLRRLTGLAPDATRESLAQALADPLVSARVMLGYYAFERKGATKAGYDVLCADLLKTKATWRSGAAFWAAFEYKCGRRGHKANARLNKRLIEHVYEHHFGRDGESWMHQMGGAMADSRDVLPGYLELLAVPGIGPKIAAFICRDVAWLFQVDEAKLPEREQWLLQPVDTWVRQIAVELWPEFKGFEESPAVDTAIALRLVAAASSAQTSAIALNQGMWYFGANDVKDKSKLALALVDLAAT